MKEAYFSELLTFEHPERLPCQGCCKAIHAGNPMRIFILRKGGGVKSSPACTDCADEASRSADTKWTPSDEQRELDDRMNYALGFAPYKQPTK
jgi:hypothetical protein